MRGVATHAPGPDVRHPGEWLMAEQPGPRRELMRRLADLSTIGLSLASSIFVGFGMGYLLDEKLFGGRTTPWFMLIFFGLGVFAGFRTLYRLTQRKDL